LLISTVLDDGSIGSIGSIGGSAIFPGVATPFQNYATYATIIQVYRFERFIKKIGFEFT
jgi:hypothetical protein